MVQESRHEGREEKMKDMKFFFMFFIPLHALHVCFASSDTESVVSPKGWE
jgi:hypothetical protein